MQDERTSTGGIVTKSAMPSGGGDTVPLGSVSTLSVQVKRDEIYSSYKEFNFSKFSPNEDM